MDDAIFRLVRDFYPLKAEYEVNMARIQQQLKELRRENDKLTKSFNELRDAVAEDRDKKELTDPVE